MIDIFIICIVLGIALAMWYAYLWLSRPKEPIA